MYILFFFNDTATTEIYTLSLHDALPISGVAGTWQDLTDNVNQMASNLTRSEEHTSELQSHVNLVCRLLLEKKKKQHRTHILALVRCRRVYTYATSSSR